jgi:hypothetical protein
MPQEYELIDLLKILTSDDFSGRSLQERLEDLAQRTALNFQTVADLLVQMQEYENTIGKAINELVQQNYDNWNNTATNYDNRNDRISTIPATPTIETDGTAIQHVLNTDGSADISFEWNFPVGEEDEYNIDGFMVYAYSGSTEQLDTATESIQYVPGSARHVFLRGVAADLYYHFGIAAYRMVDPDIAPEHQDPKGILKSEKAMADA